MAELDAGDAQDGRQDEDGGEKEEALAAHGQHGGPEGLADGLEGHAGGEEPGHQGEGDALHPQGGGADGDDLQVIVPEERHELGGKYVAQHGQYHAAHGGRLEEEKEGLPHPSVEFGAVVEAAHWLIALAQAQESGACEHSDAGDDAHGGDGGITVLPGGHVEEDGGHAGQGLPPEGGQAAGKDAPVAVKGGAEGGGAQAQVAAPEGAAHQQTEAHELADDGGQGGAAGAHVKGEDENGVQGDVQHRAGEDADHAENGAALEAELVVEHQGRDHEGGADENVEDVVLGVLGAGGGGAQDVHQGVQEEETQHPQYRRQKKGGVEGHHRHALDLLPPLLAQKPGDMVAGPLAEGEADGLDDGHEGEGHAHRRRGAGADPAHKEGVGHVVEGGDEHADDGGHRQGGHQTGDGGLGHLGEFVRRGTKHGHVRSLPVRSYRIQYSTEIVGDTTGPMPFFAWRGNDCRRAPLGARRQS